MFDDEDNPTDDPAKDQCKGCLSSCKPRFGENEELSFGGFPAVNLISNLTMRKHIIAAIQAGAAAEYPRECCGLLLAVGRAQKCFPCRNIATEPSEEFRLDPVDYAAAEDLGEVIGIVHSLPDATSRPSPHDLAMYEATALAWHILSWPEGDLRSTTPTGNTPLLNRPFVHGAWDCWQVCADWYLREWGLEFESFQRADGWWESAQNASLRSELQGGWVCARRPATAR